MKAGFILTGLFLAVGLACAAQDSVRYPLILSSRWFHPTSPQDTLSTLAMVDQYHPDRIDWMYCTNDEQIAQLRARKVPYSLALNPQVPDSAGYTVRGRIQGLSGERLVAPWMKNWTQKNPNWGCVYAPEFKEVFYAQSRRLVDLQAYGLFVDDAGFNAKAMEWGGCFCAYCMKGFTAYLRSNGADSLQSDFNYQQFLLSKGVESAAPANPSLPLWEAFRQFQTKSVISFLTTWRREMTRYAGRPLTFLANNFSGAWSPIFQVFDVGIAELPPNLLTRQHILSCTSVAKRLGKKQYFTLPSTDESNQLRALFLMYSTGSALVIPWDVFAPRKTEHTPTRFYGRAQTFAPVYELFRPKRSVLPERRNLRQSQPWKFERPNPADSLLVYEYEVTSQPMVMIQGKASGPMNEVLVQPTSATDPADLHVFYPAPSGVRMQRQGSKILIQYPGDLLVLNVPTR